MRLKLGLRNQVFALKGQSIKAQGWPRWSRPTLGEEAAAQSTLKGLSFNPTHSVHPIPIHAV